MASENTAVAQCPDADYTSFSVATSPGEDYSGGANDIMFQLYDDTTDALVLQFQEFGTQVATSILDDGGSLTLVVTNYGTADLGVGVFPYPGQHLPPGVSSVTFMGIPKSDGATGVVVSDF